MRLHNTLSNSIEYLHPVGGIVRMYVCGVTVYDHSHIGHARTIIFFDVLRRYLLFKRYKVKYVQNFTDIDDKIINRARKEGVRPEDTFWILILSTSYELTTILLQQSILRI